MNLYLRLLWLLLTFRFRARLVPPLDVSRLRLRVLPNDLDLNLHMNNGRYLTLMDLGRVDLMLRGGLWRKVIENRWMPVMSSAIIRFRRELKPFQSFCVETRILYWSEKRFVMEQKFVARDTSGSPFTAALALVRGGIYSRANRTFVDVAEVFASIGYRGVSPRITGEIETFLRADDALKRG